MANAYAAMEHDLKIIPVINKIDLTYARVDEVIDEMEQSLGIDPFEVVKCSGKAGIGIEELLTAIVEHSPTAERRSGGSASSHGVRLTLRRFSRSDHLRESCREPSRQARKSAWPSQSRIRSDRDRTIHS